VYADKSIGISTAPFPKPAAPLSIEIDCSKYYGGQRDTIPYDQKLNPTDLDDLNDQDI
jgi:penicillin-binding protein 1A